MRILLWVICLTVVCNRLCLCKEECQKITRCKCEEQKGGDVAIDCHGIPLTADELCRICEKIENVTRLNISETGFSNITVEDCFVKCYHLVELSLASNHIQNLHNDVFRGLSSVKILNLDDNKLITNGSFNNPSVFLHLPSLQELYLKNNVHDDITSVVHAKYLSNAASDTLMNLQTLFLDGLPYAEFGINFLALRNLTTVSLSGEYSVNCYIVGLTNLTFENVPFLKYLDLSNCNISSIEAETFKPLPELRHLNLSFNMTLGYVTLRNVSYGLQFTKIQVLDYSKVYKTFGLTTQLNSCDVWFFRNTTLKEVHINSNRMASIETNALALLPDTLEIVFAEDNKLTFGPFALQLGCLKNVTRMELSRQSTAHFISAYPDELKIQEKDINTSGGCDAMKTVTSRPYCSLFEEIGGSVVKKFTLPQNLKVLNEKSSNLRYEPPLIPFPFPFRNKIESVDLSNNIFYSWKDTFVRLHALKHVNLSNNFCSYVSGEFFLNCQYVESLDASHNQIGPSLAKDKNGSIFKYLNRLKVLNISHNWIESLPKDIFNHIKTLELLDISFNQIETIDFLVDHMKNLSQLFLQQNKLSTLPMALLEQLDQYTIKHDDNATIDLTANDIDASCENIEFLTWMINHSFYFINIGNHSFMRDGKRISYHELSTNFREFQKSCGNYIIIFILGSIVIVAFLSIVFGGIIYRYRWRLRYFYYMAKAKYGGYIPIRDPNLERQYRHDVFISYANENYRFATGELFQNLESAGLSLCLHQKDFVPGVFIAENILKAIKDSKITLVVLSPAFLKSKWCVYEFNMARLEGIYSRGGENVVSVVMYEDIDMTDVSPEMRECLESKSYLAFPKDVAERPYFWQLLTDALGCPNNLELRRPNCT